MPHTYVILGTPVTTTNSQRIVMIPTKKKADRLPGEEITYRPMIMRSKQFHTWKKSAKPQIEKQRAGRSTIHCASDVVLNIYRKKNQGDADNYAKGVLDLLQECRVIQNDRLFRRVTAEKFTDPSNPRIEIEITERAHDGYLFPLDSVDNEIPEEIETKPELSIHDLPDPFLSPEERMEKYREMTGR